MKNKLTGKNTIKIHAPAKKVWEALTTPSLIKKYFFGTNAVSDWKKGSPLIFRGEWQGKTYEDKGTITEVIPEKVFRYNYWSSMSGIEDKPENYANITYELEEKNGDTELTITQDNIPDEKMKEHSHENWDKVIKGLKEVVESE
jgi:uncharacterized protein YndB with AHSA1/START domain